MKTTEVASIAEAKQAALDVLVHNVRGPYYSLPRTAGWGYPEPYTRDLMIAALGILVSDNQRLVTALKRVLQTLAKNQSPLGHIPSLVHDPNDRGASDTTPLFLMAVNIFRKVAGETDFLESAVQKALTWMEYQSPTDRVIVAHLPTSDWRDEQWVWGFGLYVNTIVYAYLKLFGIDDRAKRLEQLMDRFTVRGETLPRHIREGLVLPHKPYYAFWSYKVYSNERFDLLGNCLAVLSGLAAPSRARNIISWIEAESLALRRQNELALDLPPCFFPYIRPHEPDWRPRYERFNRPGEYHNGGVWPFICAFYVAAIVAVKRFRLAEQRLLALTNLVRPARRNGLAFGFNEWFRAYDGTPCGQDWQTWSAAMYLYAAACVEQQRTPFFDDIRPTETTTDSPETLHTPST